MDIRRFDRHSTHRKVAVTAGVFILLIAGVTGAGMMVFSPPANAWPISAFGRWNQDEDNTGSLAEAGTADEKGGSDEESLMARIFGWLEDETPDVDTAALAGVASAVASELPDGETETGGPEDDAGTSTGDGGDDVVFQVTQQDVEQAMAASEEAVGFWRSLWDMIKGAFVAIANTIVSAVGAD